MEAQGMRIDNAAEQHVVVADEALRDLRDIDVDLAGVRYLSVTVYFAITLYYCS